MAHSHAEARQAESDSPICIRPGLRRKDIAKYAEFAGGCDIQTEASDSGKGGTTSDGGRKYKPEALESDSDSPACCGSGMGRKDIARLTGARGRFDRQDEASDSGIGGTGSYGKPEPIPIKPKRCHGKTNTCRIRNEFLSAPKNNSQNTRCGKNVSRRENIEIFTGAKFIGDCGGQDETFGSVQGGTISGSGNALDNSSGRKYLPKPSQRFDKTNTSIWCIGDESMMGTTTERTFLQSPEFRGGCDAQDEAYDSGKGGTESSGDEPEPPDGNDKTTNSARDESTSGFMTERISLHLQCLSRPKRREKPSGFVSKEIAQKEYDADGESSDEFDGDID